MRSWLASFALALLAVMAPIAVALLWHNRAPSDELLITEPEPGPATWPKNAAADELPLVCIPLFVPKAMRPAQRPQQEVHT